MRNHICHGYDDLDYLVLWDAVRLHIPLLLATVEQMLLHVDMGLGKAMAAPAAILDRLMPIAEAHKALPKPAAVGRFVGQRG